MLSERIGTLRSTILDLASINRIIPREIVSYEPDDSKSSVHRQAEAVQALFERVSVNHLPGEEIVGNNTTKYSPRPNHLTTAEIALIREYPKGVTERVLSAMDEHIFYLWPFVQGHIIPDKSLVLKRGMLGIMGDIELRLEDDTLSEEQRDFLEASLIECSAFLTYVKRHEDFFLERVSCAANRRERDYFMKLADRCARVPAHPAASFHDALQCVWFTQIATQFDDCANHSLGRLDQYLYPYYREDLTRGVITVENARELFFEFWLKFNLGYKLQEMSGTKMGFKPADPENRQVAGVAGDDFNPYDSRDGFSWLALKAISGINHTDDGQTMDIAGYSELGEDATNELSWLILEAVDELRTFEPKAVIKYTDKTDSSFMRRAYDIIASGFGFPAITFHEACARGLRSYGLFKEEDILNHSHIGCVELGIPGKSYTDPMNGFLNLPKILLKTLEDATRLGGNEGLGTDLPTCWEAFLENYYRQLDRFTGLYVEAMNEAGPFYAQFFSRPLVSVLVDGCIRRGLPVDNGGASYWTRSINCTGFATAVDSLFVVKKLVYDGGVIDLQELAGILGGNFQGREDFRLMIRNRVPKFGNGVEEVDKLAASVSSRFSEIVRSYRVFNGNSYRPGIYSFYEPIKSMGRVTGATPDGRKAGEVLSLNSSPSHGVIRNGLTDVLRSVATIEHSKVDNASCIDVKLTGRVKPELIGYIVDYLAEKDVLYVQFTVVDRDMLVEAQRHPDRFQDLVVRVTGFSARYVVLSRDTQEEILQRSYWC
jgi:pyruvate-formate lyase